MQNKVPKLQNINSFGSVITHGFHLPMATHIIPAVKSDRPVTLKTPRRNHRTPHYSGNLLATYME